MKNKLIFILILCLVLSMAGCHQGSSLYPELLGPAADYSAPETDPDPTDPPPPTDPDPTEPDPTEPEETQPVETRPAHSPYYMSRYTADDIIGYFAEVALDVEYAYDPNNASNSQVRKWTEPIVYWICGPATREDIQMVQDYMAQLAAIPGMPEIREAEREYESNFTITFCPLEEFMAACPGSDESFHGYVSIWWRSCRIYDGEVHIRSDIPLSSRKQMIQHEIYQGLGMLQDTARRDSIIYKGGVTATEPTELDWLIVTLLYHEAITPGMDLEDVAEVIRDLYY